jgi:hypothetical protein
MQQGIEYTIVRSTVRIEAGTSVGTGFFYKTSLTTQLTKLFIVTNKHVIKGASSISCIISTAPDIYALDDKNQPKNQAHVKLEIPLSDTNHFGVAERTVWEHPSPQVDLVFIHVTYPLGQILAGSTKLRIAFLDYEWLHSASDRPLRDIEPLRIVGYPDGVWDSINNLPVARAGSTATHPLTHFQGKTNFLVDAAVFGGSSGSPIFVFESPMFLTENGDFSPGSKASLIGILWGVVEKETSGRIVLEPIPAATQPIPMIKTSLNIGVALHAFHLNEIEELIFPGIGEARLQSKK